MSLSQLYSASIASRAGVLGPRALNPQPLPPKAVEFKRPDPLGPRALNPQPLPPRERFVARELFSSFAPRAAAATRDAAPPASSVVSRLAALLRSFIGG